MSVEIQGIKGYEYQYLATVYMALRYLSEDTVHIYVENEEDAKIIYGDPEMRKELFIQVKQHDKPVTFFEVCGWLAHFGNRQAARFLLKNIQTEGCQALFITTGRCEDRLLPYLDQECSDADPSTKAAADAGQTAAEHRRRAAVRQQDAADIRTCLTAQPANTKLERERLAALQDFFAEITDSQLRTLLGDVRIAEQQSCETVRALTASLLNTRYAVRSGEIAHVIELLEQCVRHGRDSGGDIAPDMKQVLNQHTQRLLPRDLQYLEVPHQPLYSGQLENQNVLLFTGLPFCGKTIAAQAIAQGFAAKGYDIHPTDDINEGMAFLNHCTHSKKLLLLEDPFGSMRASENRTEQARKLRRLVLEKSSADSKLIVTTRKDILFTAFDKKELAECSIGGFPWNDLTMQDISFAQKAWRAVYGDSDESAQCFSRIAGYISQKEKGVFLEIGEICNLKGTFPHVHALSSHTDEEILRHARISSEDVVDKLRDEGEDAVRIVLGLGFTCDTIRKTSYQDLAYVLSDADERPALLHLRKKSRSVRMTLGGKRPPEQGEKIPPEQGEKKQKNAAYAGYSQAFQLSGEESRLLSRLEQYGYIFIDRRTKDIRFQHPVFCYAARLLLLKELDDALDCAEYVLTARRALGAANKNVNLCALEFLYACVKENDAYRNDLRSAMFEALNSRYPAVRDRAVLLLETGFSELPRERQEQLLDAVRDTAFDQYLLWENGELMVNPKETIEPSLSEILPHRRKPPLTPEQIRAVATKADLSPKQMLDILQSSLRENLPLAFLNIALDYDESVIREKAIRLLFQNYAGQLKLSHYLNEWDNFNVICQMFQGALQSWPAYSAEDRQTILRYFTAQLGRVSVSMQAKNFLENFADEYHSNGLSWKRFTEDEKKLLWETWCAVFTEFLRQFQVDFLSMHEPHMDACMRKMAKYVKNPALLKPLFYAWNGWLSRVSCPDDYGMCLAENILLYLPPDSDRFQLLCQMLETTDSTSLLTSHIRHITDGWKRLTSRERGLVKQLLAAPREDLPWLKAIVLTREQIPEELQAQILNHKPVNSASEWLAAMRAEDLLQPCLNVYCGYPQPLWWNGYHHAARSRWDELIAKELETDCNTQGRTFQIALREFIQWEYDRSPRFQPYREALWETLLTDIQKKNAVFEQLLRTTVTTNQTNKELWDRYFQRCDDTERAASCRQIADVIESVEYFQDERGCLELFSGAIVEKYLYPLLPADEELKDLCFNVQKILRIFGIPSEGRLFDSDDEENIPDKIAALFEAGVLGHYREEPPRMKLTDILVRGVMQDAGRKSEELNQQLEICRRARIECRSAQAERFQDAYPLENWIGQ